MIGGIGSLYGSYYNYQLTINQIRQQQALAKNPNVQKYMESTSKPDRYDDQYRSSGLDFLRDYNSKMSDVDVYKRQEESICVKGNGGIWIEKQSFFRSI